LKIDFRGKKVNGDGNMENIQAVIFDLDDTLIDRQKAAKSYFRWLVNNYCPIIEDNENQVDYLLELDDLGRTDKYELYDFIINRWRLNTMTPSAFVNIWKAEFYKHTVERQHAHEILAYLSQRYPLGLISNGYSDVQINKLKKVEMVQFFKAIVVSEDIGYRKPDSKIFIETCAMLGVVANGTVFIGDHITNDVIGSRNAGLSPIWLNTIQEEIDVDCPTILSLSELRKYL
jgi:putative hydrolase of the HAD superfamily